MILETKKWEKFPSELDRNLQRECANMRSNNLNKYAITHFIMHIASVLSSISAILSLAFPVAVWGHGWGLSRDFALYFQNVAYLAFTFYFASSSSMHAKTLSPSGTDSRSEAGRKKNVIKINSNDKSNEEKQPKRCYECIRVTKSGAENAHPQYQL